MRESVKIVSKKGFTKEDMSEEGEEAEKGVKSEKEEKKIASSGGGSKEYGRTTEKEGKFNTPVPEPHTIASSSLSPTSLEQLEN